MSTPKTVYQIKVTLIGSKPPVWRRFMTPDTTTLYRLHDLLQMVMGWENHHLHMFTISGQIYGDPADDEFGTMGTVDEKQFKLNQVVGHEGSKFRYEYDFGDGWLHELIVEKIRPTEKGVRYPVCIGGKNACPPEDVGGIGGYAHFLEALADPEHLEHDEYLRWIGGEFDPESFDLDAVNDRPRHPRRSRQGEEEYYQSLQLDHHALDRVTAWSQGLNQKQIALAESLAVRRDMVTLLNYFQEKQPVGTQSTGNLQLKAVREVCAQFVHPPKLEDTIGDYHYQIRSEADVWPLFYLHNLASVSGLAFGGQARRWRLTPAGEAFLALTAPVQVGYMLFIWWYLEDWTIAFPFEGLSHGLPRDFRNVVRGRLLELKAGRFVSYESFADELIVRTGLTWASADQAFARDTLHSAIKRMAVDRLEGLGCLECEYRTKTRYGFKSKELAEIRLSAFGKGLLEAL